MDKVLEIIRSFAEKAHGDQKRKFTGERYINHPVRVMEICMQYTNSRPILAAALLHDVLEDTPVTEQELAVFLFEVMDKEEAQKTLRLVVDLTDVFIKEDYPRLNRRKRKDKEAERLEKSHPDAQTVKYADTIDNAIDITQNDIDFAPKFLSEVKYLLSKMDKGSPQLYERANETVAECFKELKKAKKEQLNRRNGKEDQNEHKIINWPG